MQGQMTAGVESTVMTLINQHIQAYAGTIHGFTLKNMLDNGAPIEDLCEAAGIPFEEEDEEDV